ncbi:hypothetical protein BDW75DRAFT_242941 [Aspergillus navahoensis]
MLAEDESNLELGVSRVDRSSWASSATTLRSWIDHLAAFLCQSQTKSQTKQSVQIEDHPEGYPRFSALLASHDSFFVCRRFSALRARLLLEKQDRLVTLERELQKLDEGEGRTLRLGSIRADDNPERKITLAKIDDALIDYEAASISPDNFLDRTHRTMKLETAQSKTVSSLRNWINGTGYIARAESAFLERFEHDLVHLASADETLLDWLESAAEELLFSVRDHFMHHRASSNPSRDRNVHIASKSTTSRIARILMTPLLIMLLSVPIVTCSYLPSREARLAAMTLATALFMLILSGSKRARAVEVAAAGAAYAAMLVEFVTGR